MVWIEDVRRAGAPQPRWPLARLVSMVVLTALALAPVLLGLGRATADHHLVGGGRFAYAPGGVGSTPLDLWPQGLGLDRLLVTPFMLVHPPLEFAAYAATTLPFAYAAAHLARGGAWIEPVIPWARRAWLLFTAALALGALWAYVCLLYTSPSPRD